MTLFVREESSGEYRRALPKEVIKEAKKAINFTFGRGSTMDSPKKVSDFLSVALHDGGQEHFGVIFLDNRNRVITFEILFSGTIDGASVHPRIIIKRALELNAAAIVCAHNHPSGHPEPSEADKKITRRIKDACEMVDIRLLDHMIVGSEITSFANRGLI